MPDPTVPPDPDGKQLMLAALVVLRDVYDDFDRLTSGQRRAAMRATAGYLQDLRAAGVIK